MPPPVTIRTLAAEAGVSPMTVSLALRNHRSISPARRARLQALARERGYRPDPAVAKLMQHLRARRANRVRSGIGALVNWNRLEHDRYRGAIISAARQRAEARGYVFEELSLGDYAGRPERLGRVVRSRGLEGLLLLPMGRPVAFDNLLDWSQFSVVATSYSIVTPAVDRVVPYMFGNLMKACGKLAERGYRRVGLALTVETDERTDHHFTAAMAWQSRHGSVGTVPSLIVPKMDFERVAAWLDREKPDVVVAGWSTRILETIRRTGRRVPRDLGVVYHGGAPAGGTALIDEKPSQIGAVAADILAGMIERGEKGIPRNAKNTFVEGEWIDGPTVRRRPTAPGGRASP